ncbi:MAG: hypothetical protein ACE5Z5_03965 [Candidatus Bathyarchaeia archaeon]
MVGRDSEADTLQRVIDEIRDGYHLAERHISLLSQVFGKRFDNAYRALLEGRVKKYLFKPSERVVWIVVGKERDYQVIPGSNFCACDDFYFRVIDHETELCYHLIAQKISEALGKYDLIEESDDMYEPLMREWRRVEVTSRKLPATEIENVRRLSEALLSGGTKLGIRQILEKVKEEGFDVSTTHHLAAILVADPEERFKCEDGVWTLREPAGP